MIYYPNLYDTESALYAYASLFIKFQSRPRRSTYLTKATIYYDMFQKHDPSVPKATDQYDLIMEYIKAKEVNLSVCAEQLSPKASQAKVWELVSALAASLLH
jgi:hypothetical protein